MRYGLLLPSLLTLGAFGLAARGARSDVKCRHPHGLAGV